MAHGFTFQELAQKDAISSEKVKKALNINSAYDKELRKGLSSLQKEQRSLMNILTRQKLHFVHKKSRLPSIHVARSSSEEAKLKQKAIAGFSRNAWVNDDSKMRNGSPPMDIKCGSQDCSKEMYKFFREKSVASNKGFMMVNDDELLDQDEDVPMSAWLSKAPKDIETNDSRLGAKVANDEKDSGRMTSPAFDSRPPRSPTFSRFNRSNMLDPNAENTESRYYSQPSSPRSPRRRANTLDTPQQLLQSSRWSDLRKIAVERSYSSPVGVERPRAESTPLDLDKSYSLSWQTAVKLRVGERPFGMLIAHIYTVRNVKFCEPVCCAVGILVQ